jgi:hypothetical protein
MGSADSMKRTPAKIDTEVEQFALGMLSQGLPDF